MAEYITDKHVVSVLRPFVRATAPMLAALRDSNPFFLVRKVLPSAEADRSDADREDTEHLAKVDKSIRERLRSGLEHVRVPGTRAWDGMTVAEREDWWLNRVGRFTVLIAAIPGVGGALADRLPIQTTLASAGQGLVLSAIGMENGLDAAERVRLIAHVLFDRDIPLELARGAGLADADEDAATADLTQELDASSAKHGRVTVKAAARTLWRFGRTLYALGEELDKRPQGRFYHQLIGMLPIVGALGDYLGERSALKRAVRKGRKWLSRRPSIGSGGTR
ncbi:hypothetical protein [Actinokineospora fastidiosa]|uniref:Uncharacterized protein n=1 Tax=Actinokineospora fastidiosa TaxID=1816 RepID=A0A918L6W4_9PSEU|nr:hypothetical protein [Actinokineospora fastidiosa]GGS13585.1 hypothetical protein GCM10010171_01720 [Actinokineospora fastidiosa]